MDLLASLGLADALPEQSTRLSHPGVVSALNDSDASGDGGGGVRLGFDRCLRCGVKLVESNSVRCKGCRRVSYCSKECRKADSTPHREDEETGCVGHSAVVCSLLGLCGDDERAEEEMLRDDANESKSNGNRSSENNSDSKREAARYRVRTERESYPATLFNVLAELPDWFADAMARRLKKRRRGKRDRPKSSDENGKERELVLHVVGASADSELWGWDGRLDEDMPEVLSAYAEASTNLLLHLKTSLDVPSCSIRLLFVGPDCPSKPPSSPAKVPVPDCKGSSLFVETHRCNYGGPKQPTLPTADAVVFFNPGFSCTDYDWSGALSLACKSEKAGSRTPFLVTTNTEMEGYADVRCLLDGGHVDPRSFPGEILEAVDHDPTNSAGKEDGEEGGNETFFFFGENPYSGLRVRQSGTMGNDLYVKSRWILGGLFAGGSGDGAHDKNHDGTLEAETSNAKCTDEDRKRCVKKRRRKDDGGSSSGKKGKNTKKKNPALI